MLKFISKAHAKFIADDDGATAIEYGLIAVGIAVAIIVAVNAVGTQLVATFGVIETELSANDAAQ